MNNFSQDHLIKLLSCIQSTIASLKIVAVEKEKDGQWYELFMRSFLYFMVDCDA